MSQLTTRSRPAATAPADPPARGLGAAAALAGAGSPLATLLVLWAVGLVGWFAADGGGHGTTTDVLRLSANGWLLAQGAALTVAVDGTRFAVTASPLGLTLAGAWVTWRLARWAGAGARGVAGLREVALAAAALTAAYAGTALVVALLAADGAAGARPAGVVLGSAVVGGLPGALGLLAGSGQASALRDLLPARVRSGLLTALGAVLTVVGAGALLVAGSLAWHAAAAARVVDRLDLGALDALLSLLLTAALAPNAALWGAAFVLGPGVALGAGTVVSTGEISLGQVPAVPLLAALPADGTPAAAWSLLLLTPVVAGALAGFRSGCAVPTLRWRSGATRGLLGGAGGAVLLVVAVAWSGGAVGPGRMAVTGADWWPVLVSGLTALGLGGAAGGLLAVWRCRRRGVTEAVDAPRAPRPPRVPSIHPQRRGHVPARSAVGTEDTVIVPRPPGGAGR